MSIFECPICGCNRLEEIESNKRRSGICIYDDFSIGYGEDFYKEEVEFRCLDCNSFLYNPNGSKVSCEIELKEWAKKNLGDSSENIKEELKDAIRSLISVIEKMN